MSENEQQQNYCGHKCQNGMCGCAGHHMGFHVLRWVLGIIVIFMVFGFGVQIGEFKSALENGGAYGYHHGMMYGEMMPANMYYGGQTGQTTVTTQAPTVK